MRLFLLLVLSAATGVINAQGPLSCCDVPGWTYVVDIVISNAGNPQTLTNHQVLLEINTQTPISQGKMNADGSDIRFTTVKCGQFLDYWIESGINSSSAFIWVMIPQIPANSVERIYMYYGNPGAAVMSSFPALFTNILTISGAQTLGGNQSAEWIDIQAGSTITIPNGQILSFNARRIIFSGTINGDFRGHGPGAGPGTGGNGGGAVAGGGGGYGGNGGHGGGGAGFGGLAYGTANGTDIAIGSGGAGSDCGASAAGGSAVSFTAASIDINGNISVRGQNAQNCCCGNTSEAAGGGSGGGILFISDYINGTGSLVASGGRGGDSDDKEGGGGGGGGRIKFLHAGTNSFSGSTNVTPGQNGNGDQCCPQPGQPGTMANVQLPPYISYSAEKPIRVFPVAAFNAGNVCSGASAAFSDLSNIFSGSIVSWQWDFGDAQNSNQQNPSHNYAAEGTYNVTLTISSDSTCTHSVSQSVTVYAAPSVSFNFQNACEGNPFNFSDQSTVINPYSITSWSWDFGDGTGTSVQQNPSYQYASAGTYNVTLTASTNTTCSNTQTQAVTVYPGLSLSLVPTDAQCQGASDGAIDLTVTGGTPNFIYSWNPGGSGEDLAAIPAGTYTVVVTDANNCAATGSAIIGEPATGVSITNAIITDASCFGGNDGSIDITVAGGAGNLIYQWSNNFAGSFNTPLVANTYSVVVTDDNGCSASGSYDVNEPPQLTLNVTPKDTTVQFGVPLQLTSTLSVSDPSTIFSWIPERDLDCYHCPNPQMFGVGTVTYYVEAQNTDGCLAYDTVTVNVELEKILYIPNAFSPNQDGRNDVFQVYTYGDKRFKLSIFNRWGGEIFVSTDITQGWDGTLNGKELDPAVFVYDVFIEYLDRTIHREQGSVMLVK